MAGDVHFSAAIHIPGGEVHPRTGNGRRLVCTTTVLDIESTAVAIGQAMSR
jgi:hypothetical protein